MVEVELWDGTRASPKPIARMEISEDAVKILAGSGKIRVETIAVGKEKGEPSKLHAIYITNLKMDISSDEFYPAEPV